LGLSVAIDYTGHSAYPAAETISRLAYARREHPEWFDRILLLYDPSPPAAPFVLSLSHQFGIKAKCQFLMSVSDKEQLRVVDEGLEFIYRLFGTENLVITWGMDSIRPPKASYPGMAV